MKNNKHIILLILLLQFINYANAQKAIPFKIYKSNGKKTSYKKLIRDAKKSDIIFIGEEHNNPVSHWFELLITKELYNNSGKKIILGAEMMERDNDSIYQKYLNGKIKYKQLKKKARLWSNFKTDYKPLLDFAKKHKIKFVSTNIPRRYANKVFRYGFKTLDSLSAKEKKWIAPLPIAYDSTLTSYVEMTKMKHIKQMPKKMQKNIAKAQAVKDATMAYFILKNFENGSVFIHYNGSFHSKDKQGIIWYIKHRNPNLKILTIDFETQDNIFYLNKRHEQKANYIIIVDKHFPKSY